MTRIFQNENKTFFFNLHAIKNNAQALLWKHFALTEMNTDVFDTTCINNREIGVYLSDVIPGRFFEEPLAVREK